MGYYFFIVKGTISTLLIVTGAKYFDLSFMQLFVLILILLLISLISRKLLYRHKQNKSKRAKYIRKPQRPLDFWGFIYSIVSFGSVIRMVHPISFIGCKSKERYIYKDS